jgi:hypothetical protein
VLSSKLVCPVLSMCCLASSALFSCTRREREHREQENREQRSFGLSRLGAATRSGRGTCARHDRPGCRIGCTLGSTPTSGSTVEVREIVKKHRNGDEAFAEHFGSR